MLVVLRIFPKESSRTTYPSSFEDPGTLSYQTLGGFESQSTAVGYKCACI